MSTVTLRAYDLFTGKVRGELTVTDGQVRPGSDRAMAQSVSNLTRAGRTPEQAVELLDGRNIGGRITWSTTPVPLAPAWWRNAPEAERFDPHQLRDRKGRWAKQGVGALSKVYNEIPETRGKARGQGTFGTAGGGRAREEDTAIAAWRKGHPVAPPITRAEARDEARPVSADEFQALAREGLNELAARAWNKSPPDGLRNNWLSIKAETYAAVQGSWGGATIDAHTGMPVPADADAYALSVKPKGMDPVRIAETASRADFEKAMDIALSRFAGELSKAGFCLGVFHDDDEHSIDIDPVLVVGSRREVETIGAYTHAVGGAYNFRTGDGYFPPYVAEEEQAAA